MKLPHQIIRFCVVGGLATGLQYVILVCLVHLGLGPVLASSIGFCCSALLNYALNRRFTFESQREHRHALPRFALTALVGLGINGFLLWLFVVLGTPHYLLAQVGATIGTLAWNFVVNRQWTFRSVPVSRDREIAQ